MRSDRLGETLLPKRIALPVFASDAMSSVAYATQEILIVLALAGTAYLHFTWYAAAGVMLVLLTVVAAYRQNVYAYPSGGGDYEVANTNLGPKFGLVVAAALLVDYVLTVAVSTTAGVENLASTPAFSWMGNHKVETTLVIVAIIVMLNLRGIRESGFAFAIPTYAFMVGIIGMVAVGCVPPTHGRRPRGVDGEPPDQARARAPHQPRAALPRSASLRLRLYGADRGRGDLQRSAGLPQAQVQERGQHAGADGRDRPGDVRRGDLPGDPPARPLRRRQQHRKPGRMAAGQADPDGHRADRRAVFGGNTNLPFYFVQFITAIILVLAANTAFNGFPVLASILAQDRYAPRQLHTRGRPSGVQQRHPAPGGLRRSADLGVSGANSTTLIQLYIVGVFVSFTLQPGGHGPALEPAAPRSPELSPARSGGERCGAEGSARSHS